MLIDCQFNYTFFTPTTAGSFIGKFSQCIDSFNFKNSHDNSYFSPSCFDPLVNSSSDHNGFGSSLYATTLVCELRTQAYQPSWNWLTSQNGCTLGKAWSHWLVILCLNYVFFFNLDFYRYRPILRNFVSAHYRGYYTGLLNPLPQGPSSVSLANISTVLALEPLMKILTLVLVASFP